MQDRYKHAEEEYFKLRGQFDTGRITQEQFDEKLRELMIQDANGRYWMIGADSGKWYFYDGAKWVQGEPYVGASPPPLAAPVEALPAAPPSLPSANVPASQLAFIQPPPTASARSFPLVPILILLALVVLGIVAFLVFQNRERIFVAQRPQAITPILPPTITRAPSPTAGVIVPTTAPATLAPTATAVPPAEVPTNAPPTDVPATNAPPVTIVVVTSEPSATPVLPTLLPTATNVPPTVAPTKKPATATNVPPTNTAVPSFPPNVYVTKIEYSSPAKRNQNVTFTATFLNTTGGAANYPWLILLYDPEKTGNNKGFGESPATPITIPTGESKFSTTYIPVNGPGGCKNLYMRAGWKISAFDKPIFPNTSGDPVTVFFDVCP